MKNYTNVIATVTQYMGSRTTEDMVVLLTALHPETFTSKAESREWLAKYMADNDLTVTKPKSKKDTLRDWFLEQDEPLKVTKAQLKEACLKFDMHGGSVDFYATAYMMAIDIHSRLTK